MEIKSFKEYFIKFCEINKFEKNSKQLEIIDRLIKFFEKKKNIFNFFTKKNQKKCFYLYGGVGIGKTMILNKIFEFIDLPKKKIHFNEFMIDFHDYRHKNTKKSIESFVKKIKKKHKLIFLDELQVTNIVDAMILGKLFEIIFSENLIILISSNIKIDNLYKDGLQRDQFIPFIKILKKNSELVELTLEEDYRKLDKDKRQRIFYPINEKTTFKINQLFREITKNKTHNELNLTIKGRNFFIPHFYSGIARFNFRDLCDSFVGAEDYIKVAQVCNFIIIENIPDFDESNSNQQQRFITLIDILYEKKVSLLISLNSSLDDIKSSKRLVETFKRTLSRLVELTNLKVV